MRIIGIYQPIQNDRWARGYTTSKADRGGKTNPGIGRKGLDPETTIGGEITARGKMGR